MANNEPTDEMTPVDARSESFAHALARAVAERDIAIREKQRAEDRLQNAIKTHPQPLAINDGNRRLLHWNDPYATLWTDNPTEVQEGMQLRDLVELGVQNGRFTLPDSRPDEIVDHVLAQLYGVKDREPATVEMAGDRAYQCSRSLQSNGDFLVFWWDITELRHQATELERAAVEIDLARVALERQLQKDPLTGIGNRLALSAALKDLLPDCAEHELAVLHIGLDRFKEINATFGHAAGDTVLKDVAHRLVKLAGEGAVVSRVGGDEFVIVVCISSQETLDALAADLIRALNEPFWFEGRPCRAGASIGIATNRVCGNDGEALLDNSDIALYRAKDAGRNRAKLFDTKLRQELDERKRIADEIAAALENSQFVPYYHPQFDSQSLAFRGVEVLARWHHPERGLIMPNAFLPVAETLSVIDQIDRMILHKAIEECSDLCARGVALQKMSFNVSESRVRSQELIDDLQIASDLPFTLAIELLESIYIEEEGDDFLFTIDLLQELGLRIEVDDFGSGRASVVALTRINPDAIKIDQRLVAPIEDREEARAMLKAIVDIGHALDIEVLAEGVETEGQIQLLREMGCQALQGFYFAKPLPITALSTFLAEDTARFQVAAQL